MIPSVPTSCDGRVVVIIRHEPELNLLEVGKNAKRRQGENKTESLKSKSEEEKEHQAEVSPPSQEEDGRAEYPLPPKLRH